jgi:hypothetical protein
VVERLLFDDAARGRVDRLFAEVLARRTFFVEERLFTAVFRDGRFLTATDFLLDALFFAGAFLTAFFLAIA